jgi:hypothetical protein
MGLSKRRLVSGSLNRRQDREESRAIPRHAEEGPWPAIRIFGRMGLLAEKAGRTARPWLPSASPYFPLSVDSIAPGGSRATRKEVTPETACGVTPQTRGPR